MGISGIVFVAVIRNCEVLIWFSEIWDGILHEGVLTLKVVIPESNKVG